MDSKGNPPNGWAGVGQVNTELKLIVHSEFCACTYCLQGHR